ncbi:restriction endonuclease subunit S [Pseudomonas oryzihabitans]|uniref:restriction endonuclease subunit S n=1 Tax=Pseudomonas oryzihabitans TaxID=47885 RepID=UPI001121B7F8|nr:restriction endonuclease subunit S [Pseudomonas psychrotolerans]QDD89669.1 hypothetical protein CCZ28_11825 [Pseudomonas psychrotolerans]
MNELPTGWAEASISDLADLNPKQAFDDEATAGFVPMSHAPTNFLDKLRFEERPWGDIKKAYTNFKNGDVIFAKVTPCFENGKAAYVEGLPNGIGAGSSEFFVLRPSCDDVSSKYLLALVKSHNFLREGAENMTGAVGLRRVPKQFVESYPVKVPPAAEQTRIAAKLDELLAQVDTLKVRIDGIPALLKRFRQSVLAAAVSGKLTEEWRTLNDAESVNSYIQNIRSKRLQLWQETQVNSLRRSQYKKPDDLLDEEFPELPEKWMYCSVSEISSRVTYGLTVRPSYVEIGAPVISAKEIKSGVIDYENAKRISFADHKSQREKCKIFQGDILFSKTGTIGSVARADRDIACCSSQNVAVVSPLINSKFVAIVFRSKLIQDLATRNIKTTAIPDLQLGVISRFPVPLTSEREQIEIVRRVEQLFSVADQVELFFKVAQARIDRLTQSILAKAFRGELVPQDPNDEPASVLLERIKAQRAAAPKARRGRQAAKLS